MSRDDEIAHVLRTLADYIQGMNEALDGPTILECPDFILVRMGVPQDKLLADLGAGCLVNVPNILRRMAAPPPEEPMVAEA